VSNLAALVGDGFLLGWSVAWPPGPINAEMMRRGLAQGFRPAFAVGLGACSGDALWAIAVVLGAGLLVGGRMRGVLAGVSVVLLLALAAIFFKSAWQAWRHRAAAASHETAGSPRFRGSYLLGLTMALSSPWNIAFWLAVIGRPQSQLYGVTGGLVVAGSVILGAGLWCLVFCTATARLRRNLAGPIWQVGTTFLTGLLMLAFALNAIRAFIAV
jgi:threonine/homoserine/homoserine lactone efflux protein